ncbi:MAG: ABC transporter permease [Acidobacteria bacterium]|nr:ABC transporter permease [Acidobacteriota bacterium]
MTPRLLLRRSLTHYKGIHLSVALGVAVGTAVLAGALLVGDSVRGSLRDLTLDRLGEIDHALVSDHYFREKLADDLGEATNFAYAFGKAAPAVLIRGSLEAADTGARASRVNIHGVDERFLALYPNAASLPAGRELLINQSLARELGVEAGGGVLLRFQTDTLVPSEFVMGRKSENVRTLRLTVAAVLPDQGIGRFGLAPSQQLPFNVFLPIAALQRALEQEGRANALFVSSSAEGDDAGADNSDALAAVLRDTLSLDDLNLKLRKLDEQGVLVLETDRIVLEVPLAEAAERAAGKAGLTTVPVLTYLANTIAAGDRQVPYSTVTALDLADAGAAAQLRLMSGEPAPALAENEILINDWTAKDLGASPGDPVTLSYYVIAANGGLDTATATFTLNGVVKLEGLAADRDLAPPYKGMSEAQRMGDWDPPFPVELSRIRGIDEDYWERYHTAPKAFVSLDAAKRLWTSRFGQLSSLRFVPGEGKSLDEAAAAFRKAFRAELDPAAYGLAFQAVKAQGLAASNGATDFSGLFIGFSIFLIVSAAMLVALLFRLGVERRAKEIGLLLATGRPIKQVRRLLLAEGATVSLVGILIGLPGAIAYGALMVYGLRTWWSAAVGGSFLTLHITPASLVGGVIGALIMMVVSIWLAVRKLVRFSPRSLLAGALEEDRFGAAGESAGRRPRWLAYGAGGLAALLIGLSVAGVMSQLGAFFGGGALLLIAALAYFRASLANPSAELIVGKGRLPMARLGVRNGARYPTRSVLSAALVASATFVIVTVALSRHDVTKQEPSFDAGDGGFRFVAESDMALFQTQLSEQEQADAAAIFPLRRKLGEDASCLNLYQPSRPTLLGATPRLVERGGFAFQGTLAESSAEEENPWLILDRQFEDGAIPVFGDLNSVMWILHLGLGRQLEMNDDQGNVRKLVVAGLMPRSLFQSQLIMSEKNFLDMFPGHSGYNFFLIETADESVGASLEDHLGEVGFDAGRTADRLAGYLIVENTYLSTFQTLGGLGLLLGTFGLAVVMIRNVLERRAELALLQAVGFNRASISWLVLAENAFVLVFGILIGAVTALLAVLPQLLSGMAEPPVLSLSVTLLLILALGLAAGAVAVGTSLRTALTPALRGQ